MGRMGLNLNDMHNFMVWGSVGQIMAQEQSQHNPSAHNPYDFPGYDWNGYSMVPRDDIPHTKVKRSIQSSRGDTIFKVKQCPVERAYL